MIKSLIWIGFERLIQFGSGIAIAGILLTHLGAVDYAAWQYSFSVYGLMLSFTWFCGAELLTPRIINLSNEKRNEKINSFIQIKILASIFVMVGGMLFCYFQKNKFAQDFLFVLMPLILVREPLMTGFSIFQVDKKIELYSKISIFGVLLKLSLLYLLFNFEKGGGIVAVPWLIEGLVVSVLTFKIARLNFSEILKKIDVNELVQIAKAGFYIWLTIILAISYLKLDKIILKEFIEGADYVNYAASSQLNENLIALSTMMLQVILPYYIYTVKDKKHVIARMVKLSIAYGFILIVVAAFISVYSHEISKLIFKEDVLSDNLPLLIFLLPLLGVDGIANSYYYRGADQKILVIKSVLIFAGMLIINKFLMNYINPIFAQVASLYFGLILGSFFTVFCIWKDAARDESNL